MHIGQLIKSRPVNLETVLLHEQFLQSLKDGNPMVIQYITSERKHLLQLLDLLTLQPPPSNIPPPEKAFFLPFLASEIFECSIQEINQALLDDPQLLTHVFKFLAQKTPVNGTNAAYFAKLLTALIHGMTQKTLNYIYSNKQVIVDLQNQSQNQSISDLIISILLISKQMKALSNQSFQTAKLDLIQSIINSCSTGNDNMKQSNGINILTEITNNYSQILDGEQMIELIIMNIDSYFKNYFINNNPRRNLELIKICTVFYSIIKFEKNATQTHLLTSAAFKVLSQSISKNLKNLQISLNQQQYYREFQHGMKQQICGVQRQVFVDIVNELLIINDDDIINSIIVNNTMQIMVDYLIKFMWNNLLHVGIEICFINMLNNKNNLLIDNLFKKKKIYHIFIDQLQEMQFASTNKGGFEYTKGNVSYFINISNSFNEDQYVHDIVSKSERWDEFTRKQLTELNKKTNIAILDVNLLKNPNASLTALTSKKSICVESINTGGTLSLFAQQDASAQFQEIQQQIDNRLFINDDEQELSESSQSSKNLSERQEIADEQKEYFQPQVIKKLESTGSFGSIDQCYEDQYTVERLRDDHVGEVKLRMINQDDIDFLERITSNQVIDQHIRGSDQSIRVSDEYLLTLVGQ